MHIRCLNVSPRCLIMEIRSRNAHIPSPIFASTADVGECAVAFCLRWSSDGRYSPANEEFLIGGRRPGFDWPASPDGKAELEQSAAARSTFHPTWHLSQFHTQDGSGLQRLSAAGI